MKMKSPSATNIEGEQFTIQKGGRFSTFLELVRKTFFYDLFSPLKFLISILGITGLSMILFATVCDFSSPMESAFTDGAYLMFAYLFGAIYPLFIMIPTELLLSKEFSEGTILVLNSHPFSRSKIMICKITATFLYVFVLNISSLGVMTMFLFFLFGFYDLVPFFFVNLLFSLIFLVFLTGASLGFSAITKKPSTSVILSFSLFVYIFIYSYITMIIGSSTAYGDFHLYLPDLKYHAANVYLWLTKAVSGLPSSTFELFYFFNLYEFDPMGRVETNYLAPEMSLILLVSIGIIILSIGYIRFIKREL